MSSSNEESGSAVLKKKKKNSLKCVERSHYHRSKLLQQPSTHVHLLMMGIGHMVNYNNCATQYKRYCCHKFYVWIVNVDPWFLCWCSWTSACSLSKGFPGLPGNPAPSFLPENWESFPKHLPSHKKNPLILYGRFFYLLVLS